MANEHPRYHDRIIRDPANASWMRCRIRGVIGSGGSSRPKHPTPSAG